MDDIYEYTRYICYFPETQLYVSGSTGGYNRSADPQQARIYHTPGKISQSIGRSKIDSGEAVIVPVNVQIDRAHLTIATLGGVIEGATLKPKRK